MSKRMKQNISIALSFLILFGGSIFFMIKTLGNVTQPQQRLEDNSQVSKIREEKQQVDEGETETMNILLLGLDGEFDGDGVQNQETRTDAIVVLSINPNTKSTKMMSIPRDTRVYYSRYDNYDKINHAYVYGGPQLTMQLVEELLHIPIDYYASVNMKGLEELVDAIGGVEITSPLTFTYRGTEFNEGRKRKVDGVKAMNFIRMRKEDPQGDFGRQERQRILIMAIADKLMDMSPVEYTKLVPFLVENVRTDVDITSAYDLYKGYKSSVRQLDIVDARGAYSNVIIDGIYYMLMDDDVRQRIANELRVHSGISELSTVGYHDYYADDRELHNSELQEVEEEDIHLYDDQQDSLTSFEYNTNTNNNNYYNDNSYNDGNYTEPEVSQPEFEVSQPEPEDSQPEPTPAPESAPVESLPEPELVESEGGYAEDNYNGGDVE